MLWWWDALYWLPRGVGWEDMYNQTTEPGYMYPHYSHLWMTVLTGISLIIYRFVFENYIFVPLAYYLSRKNPPETRQGVLDREKKYTRMAECAMRALYYFLSFCSGLYLVSNESHFYDITECWRKWPFHPIPTAISWYYWIQGGFYIALVFGILFLDAKRSDFWQMLVHHFITLALIGISWIMNMTRVGTLILVSHDAVDILIDVGKILRYEQLDTALAICFAGVLIVWVVTRLVYYPFWVIRSVWFDAPALIQDDYEWLNLGQQPQAPRFIMFLLTALLVLHIFWAYILFKIAYDTVKYGVVDDVREDFDENSAVNREKSKNQDKNKDD
ncbi:CBN-HYL-2 protein [Caenorhabditis brenneri]|uniref:CBN-HYL-2 protein n=1 Tax=Caenorhabditis brenneri TaxID=135651 RepID=G0M888_CAEBE|nr:CBN-HYL-2 protein [Caenorhabditis brenneri]